MMPEKSTAIPEYGFNQFSSTIKRNIWLFAIFIALSICLAFLYNRYKVPTYKVSGTLLIKESERVPFSEGKNDLFVREDKDLNKNIQSELRILKSYPIIQKTLENLNFDVSYYEKIGFQKINKYGEIPFDVIIYKDHVQLTNTIFNVEFITNNTFNLIVQTSEGIVFDYKTNRKVGSVDCDYTIRGTINTIIENDDIKLKISPKKTSDTSINSASTFSFEIESLAKLTEYYRNSLMFSVLNDEANVVDITLESSSIKLAKDLINELMDVYSESNLSEKNLISNLTINYIENQLSNVSESLSSTEDSLQNFRSKNQMINADKQTEDLFNQYIDLQDQLAELVVQKRYLDYLANTLNNKDESQILTPSAMGVEGPLFDRLIIELSDKQNQKAILVNNNQSRNPMVKQLSVEIENIKSALFENINSVQKTNEIAVFEMNERIKKVEEDIRMIPMKEMELGGIERSYQLNDAIYNYLLQKHAEAKIKMVSNLPDNKIIEPAFVVGGGPVSPNKFNSIFAALLIGFMFPLSILVFKEKLNSKVNSVGFIEDLSQKIIFASINSERSLKKNRISLLDTTSTQFAESIRSLRTNILYSYDSGLARSIAITSSVTGDGKSTIAVNLATSFALSGAKTILLNMDLRKEDYLFQSQVDGTCTSKGFHSYIQKEVEISEIISNTKINNLGYIHSGKISRNPLDIVSKQQITDLFKYLKTRYEYIIIDTPPVGQVSDFYQIVDFIDMCLLIVKNEYTPISILKYTLNEFKRKSISRCEIVFNGVPVEKNKYGYY